jgi:hypothetical protein
MRKVQESAVANFRNRMKRQGVVRVEVYVRKDDVSLVRNMVKALADPSRESGMRALLREQFGETRGLGLKALLAAAPTNGLSQERSWDASRMIEL